MKKYCGIYIIQNLKNGKKYVGKSVNIFNRWRGHRSTLNKDKHPNNYLQRSFNKYGIENFIFGIVEELPVELLHEREVYWIKYYDTYNTGYNLIIPTKEDIYDREAQISRAEKLSIRLYDKNTRELKHEFNNYIECSEFLGTDKILLQDRLSAFMDIENKLSTHKGYIILKRETTMEQYLQKQHIRKLNIALQRAKKKGPEKIKYKLTPEQLSRKNKLNSMKATYTYKPVEMFLKETNESIGKFNSVSEIASKMGWRISYIRKVLYGEKKSYQGYYFKYI